MINETSPLPISQSPETVSPHFAQVSWNWSSLQGPQTGRPLIAWKLPWWSWSWWLWWSSWWWNDDDCSIDLAGADHHDDPQSHPVKHLVTLCLNISLLISVYSCIPFVYSNLAGSSWTLFVILCLNIWMIKFGYLDICIFVYFIHLFKFVYSD